MNDHKGSMPPVRVLKLGGSLLLIPDWPRRLQSWLSSHPAPLDLLLVGGGEIVESVRRLDAQHGFPASFSHWLCIDLLSATARIAAQLLPEFPMIATSEALFQIAHGQRRVESTIGNPSDTKPKVENRSTYLVDVSSFYSRPSRQDTSAAPSQSAARSTCNDTSSTITELDSTLVENRTEDCPLPENWDTTSDSLAAWLAHVVRARELILFKSMTPAIETNTPQAWVEQGFVDAAFADALPDNVSVHIVNLLSENREVSFVKATI
ncbi:MAG: hypothetical protein IT422_23530 [Pirellulaceae bacterium]|jgi:aspartokinase-like uncharacterized kinase|nr:hypothetical protein [Pirellulaceae bacterium]